MKKYTIIYMETFQVGSHQTAITKLQYIECSAENLRQEIETIIGWGNVTHVLEGHCIETKD